MVRQAWALLLATFLMAPLADASGGEGGFSVDGALTFPSGSNSTGTPRALFVRQTGDLSALRVHASEATVSTYRVPFRGADVAALGPAFVQVEDTQTREWTVKDAVLTLVAGDHRGILGIDPSADARLTLVATDAVAWEPRLASDVGDWMGPGGAEPGAIGYQARVTGPHLLGSGNGSVAYVGKGRLQLVGPDVEIRSSNVTLHRTGASESGLAERTFTVVSMRFDAEATVEIAGVPFEGVLQEMDAAWDGALRFTPRAGEMRTPEGTYASRGGAADLDGRFQAHLLPTSAGEGRLDLSGDLRSSTLAFAPAATRAPGLPMAASWGALLLAAAVLVGAAGGVAAGVTMLRQVRAALALHAPRPPFTVEDCVEAANAALDVGDDAEALEWLRRAEVLAPTSARIAADLGFCLTNLGAVDEALDAYRKAHVLSGDGEAAYHAALAAHEAGRPAEAVLGWLGEALERTPQYVESAREDFPRLLDRPAWRALERRARERGGVGA